MFSTAINVDIYSKNNNESFSFAKTTVEWDVEIIKRDWGISDISPIIRDQSIVIEYTDENDEEKTLEFNLKDVEVELEFPEFYSRSSLGLSPTELYIDLKRNKNTLTFQVTSV